MNKKIGVLFSGISLSLLLTNFISALTLYEGVASVWDNITKILVPIFSFLLGGNLTGGALFTKALIFTIIISLVWIGMTKINLFNQRPIIQKIITVIISILAIQGISYGFLDVITLPYTVTGIALSAGLPFVIFFFIIHKGFGEEMSSIARRIAWIFFAVIFFGLVFEKIGGFGNILNPDKLGYYWIYYATGILAIAMAFLDGTIRGFFAKAAADRIEKVDKAELLAKILKKKEDYKVLEDSDKETYELLMKRLRADLKRAGIKRRI